MDLQFLLKKADESDASFVDRIPREIRKLNSKISRDSQQLLIDVLRHESGLSYEEKIKMLETMIPITENNAQFWAKKGKG